MKKILFAISFIVITASGCKKENQQSVGLGTCSDGIKNQNETAIDCGGICSPCNTPAQTGTVKANVTVRINSSNSSYVYSFESGEARLKDNNYNLLATEIIGGSGTVNFGTFNYGTYHVYVSGKERKTSLQSGSSIINQSLSDYCDVTLYSTQNTC